MHIRFAKIAGFSVCFANLALAGGVDDGVSFGAFVDAYYAYDFRRPTPRDRAYTTQPARHNEFNLNLAHVEGKLGREKVRGRLALQAGTSVQSNYANEATHGTIGGPTLARHVQEAFVGYRLAADTWVDAGIMFSHLGLESFVSKENLTYTRSLVADYSPYYQSGVRVQTKLSEHLGAQFLVLNGWQNVSETNGSKAIGTQLAYAFSERASLAYNTFFGREAAFRHFHDVTFRISAPSRWTFAAQADFGFQRCAPGGANARWHGFTGMARYAANETIALVVRGERYADLKQVLITTPSGAPFRVWGASFGIDTALDLGVAWRNEVRGFFARDAIFPGRSGLDRTGGVAVSAISAGF